MNGISILLVIPVYNEENIIEDSVKKLEKVLNSLIYTYEIILVDDGSKDNTWKKIEKLENERRGGDF